MPRENHDHHHDADAADAKVDLLDLEAEALAEHTAAIAAWLPVDADPRQIVDLGCGTGAGTFALLAQFPEARVTAVDSSAVHLNRLRDKAYELAVADRVHTVEADLDESWPDLGEPGLVWASASLHHIADPDRVLRRIHGTLAPGGLFALVELAGFPRFLPADAPEDRPGVEERCHAVLDRRHAGQVPHRGADWRPRLTAAGFTVEGERPITVHIEHSRADAVGRYALTSLRRIRGAVDGALPADDLAALDRLLDTGGAHSILRRDDLAVRTERVALAARPVPGAVACDADG